MWTKKNYKLFWNKPGKMKVVYGGQLRLTADKRSPILAGFGEIFDFPFIRKSLYAIISLNWIK